MPLVMARSVRSVIALAPAYAIPPQQKQPHATALIVFFLETK
jgi:hypothetical protein